MKKYIYLFPIILIFSCSYNKYDENYFKTLSYEKVKKDKLYMTIYCINIFDGFDRMYNPENLEINYDFKIIVQNKTLLNKFNYLNKINNIKVLEKTNKSYDDYIIKCNYQIGNKIIYSYSIGEDKTIIWLNGNYYKIDNWEEFLYLIPISLPGFRK